MQATGSSAGAGESAPGARPGYPSKSRRLWWNRAAVLVVVAVGVAGLGYYLIVVAPQPNIVLTGSESSAAGCSVFGGQWTYTFTFTLVNTGGADGFAVVELFLNGLPNVGTYRTVTFFVPHGAQAPEQASITAADCGSYTPGAALISAWKA